MPYARLADERWFYHTWGNPERPPLLVLHGFTGSHASWSSVAPALAEDFYVIAPDLPGHGRTDTPSPLEKMSMVQQAHRLVDLIESLSIPKARVLGYSMGGRLALHLAWRYPERVSLLILESASPGLALESERAQRRASDEALAAAIMSRGLAWFIDHWNQGALFRDQAPEVREAENAVRRTGRPEGLAQSLLAAGTGSQESLWDILGDLPMPVLLITGERDRKFTGLAKDMVARIPGAQWVSIEAAGHTVHGENPEAFLSAVRTFLHTSTGN